MIGYTNGVFDLFHYGHLEFLNCAKSKCDFLIVALCPDDMVEKYKNKKPIIPFEQRKKILEHLDCVDKVVTQISTNRMVEFDKYKFDIYFHGEDGFEFDKNTGKVTEKNENPVLKIAKRKEQIDSRVQLVADYVVLHPREKYTPQKMAEMVELSKQRFSSLFKANMGKSPMEYVREIRLTTAARALLVSNKNINDIAYECGYEDANYFIREFKSAFGFTPNQYRKIARE